jgi:hypothetical protein
MTNLPVHDTSQSHTTTRGPRSVSEAATAGQMLRPKPKLRSGRQPDEHHGLRSVFVTTAQAISIETPSSVHASAATG